MRYVFLFALAGVLSSPAIAQTEPARPVVQANETILRVKGEGMASSVPTQMRISIGVVTTGDTAVAALDANNQKLEPVIAALKKRGIPAKNIQTSSLSVEPRYSEQRSRDEERIIGFRASNRLSVTTDDLENAGDLISVLFDSGANSIDGPYFEVGDADKEPLTRVAEADALREARAQADATAGALGMRVARILLVSDSQVNFRESSGYIVVTGSRISRTPIEPGEIDVTATYDVEFALVPK